MKFFIVRLEFAENTGANLIAFFSTWPETKSFSAHVQWCREPSSLKWRLLYILLSWFNNVQSFKLRGILRLIVRVSRLLLSITLDDSLVVVRDKLFKIYQWTLCRFVFAALIKRMRQLAFWQVFFDTTKNYRSFVFFTWKGLFPRLHIGLCSRTETVKELLILSLWLSLVYFLLFEFQVLFLSSFLYLLQSKLFDSIS